MTRARTALLVLALALVSPIAHAGEVHLDSRIDLDASGSW
jgi:hypothetical protein